MDSLKIESMLSLLHEENRVILAHVAVSSCKNQEEYDNQMVEILTKWDTAYAKIMRIENEKEQSGENDSSRAADSN